MTTKLFTPITLLQIDGKLFVEGYPEKRPYPSQRKVKGSGQLDWPEYEETPAHKKWQQSKVRYPVQEASDGLIEFFVYSKYFPELGWNSAEYCEKLKQHYRIDELADRLEVVYFDGNETYVTNPRHPEAFIKQIRLIPEKEEVRKNIIDANDPRFLVGVLRSIEREMPKAKRKRLLNVTIVKDYLLAHTSKGGKSSAYEMCEHLGIDPDLYTFNK